MSSSNRGERIETLQKLLKKHYKPVAIPTGRSVLENLIYACLLEDAKFEVADELFAKVQQEYFDWNEARVTTITELAELFAIHPMPVQVALRIKKILQAIFEARYAYDIEDLAKLNLGKATETIESWLPSSRFVSSFMQQNAFGGHSIAVDNSTMQALVAIGVAQSVDVQKGTVSGLERAVAKAKGPELFSLIHQYAVEYVADKKAPGVQAIVAELGVELPPARAAKPTKVAEKPAPPPPPPPPPPTAKKGEKKEAPKEAPKETPLSSPTKPTLSKPAPGSKPPLQVPMKGAAKPEAKSDSAKSTSAKNSDAKRHDTKGKAPPPKPVAKEPPAKPGKGDTKKPNKPMAKAPPPPPAKSATKKPAPPPSKNIAKKKPK